MARISTLLPILLLWLLSLAVPVIAFGQELAGPWRAKGVISAKHTFNRPECGVHRGWQGYFALPQWELQLHLGDGGVEVTGAPTVGLVEGADSTQLSIEAVAGQAFALQITIPADGYLRLMLQKAGSSLLPPSADTLLFWIRNGRRQPADWLDDGTLFSPRLYAGDRLALYFSGAAAALLVSELAFYTSGNGSSGVTMADIHWPAADETEGWPFLPAAGPGGQALPLKPGNSYFRVEYTDEERVRGNERWIIRHFRLHDPASCSDLYESRWWKPAGS